MTRRTAVRAAFLVVLLLAGVAPADAQSTTGEPEVGVWWRLRADSALPPAPLVDLLVDVPEGGLWVSGDPTGEQAVSALRASVPAGAVAEEIVLHVDTDRSSPDLAVLLCAAADLWQPPDSPPGPWSERPAADCDQLRVGGVVDGQGERVRFLFPRLDPGRRLDLVLVPGDGAYVDATFRAPSAADIRLAPVASPGGFTAPAPSSGAATPAREAAVAAAPTPAPAGDFDVPRPQPSPSPESSGREMPAAAPPPAGTAAPPTPVAFADQPAWDAGRWAALVVFVLLAGWIAAILISRLRAGETLWASAGPRFTLYRGVPPGPSG